MFLGIHRAFFPYARRELGLTLTGFVFGGALCAWSAHAAVSQHHDILPFLLLVLFGITVIVFSLRGFLIRLLWLRRASWVLQSVEPEVMNLSIKAMTPRGVCRDSLASVSLTPLRNRSLISKKTDLPVFFASRRRKRKHSERDKSLSAVIYADPHENGPIVIRMESYLLCSMWNLSD